MNQLEATISAVQQLLDLGETPDTEPLLKGLVHTVSQPYDACVDGFKPVTGYVDVLRPDAQAIERRLSVQRIPATTASSVMKYRTTTHSCQCPDHQNREGGSYLSESGERICKHIAHVRAMHYGVAVA